jgi:hypothetical protein
LETKEKEIKELKSPAEKVSKVCTKENMNPGKIYSRQV